MKFTLKKIGGGFHPIIKVTWNYKKCIALIDTGANISCHISLADEGVLQVGKIIIYASLHSFEPSSDQGYEILLGSDFLRKTGAVIDYQKKEIRFMK